MRTRAGIAGFAVCMVALCTALHVSAAPAQEPEDLLQFDAMPQPQAISQTGAVPPPESSLGLGGPLPFLAQPTSGGVASNVPPRPRQAQGASLPLQPTRRIAFSTQEGTWMSVDVSPDGSQLVFDLLGDLYTLSVTGGNATAITHGLPFDSQPVYSPDGRWIAFVSDRSGADNLWLIHPDGSELHQVSFGDDDTELVSPAWTPDGQALYVSRFSWSVDNYELWRYSLDGKETLVVPVAAAGQARSAGVSSLGATPASDGQQVYFSRRTGTSDLNGGVDDWSVVSRNLKTGVEETVLPDPGGPSRRSVPIPYFRPVLSPDGQRLVYATRYQGSTGLRIRDLVSGADRWLAYPVEHDQIQAQSWQDLLPRFAFTPDGRALILSRGGKLERLSLDDGKSSPIPFTANVDIPLGPLTRVAIKQDTGPVRARLIQTPEQSPDGSQLAFSALGHIYLMPLRGHGQRARRLTTFAEPEFHPSWSPDGRNVVFVTWSARGAGQVWSAPVQGGQPRQLTQKAAYYTRPVFTPDGKSILVQRSSQRGRLNVGMEFGQVRQGELIELPGERIVYAGSFGGKPHFSAKPGAVFVRTANGVTPLDLHGGGADPAIEIRGPGWYFMDHSAIVDDSRMSPDGHWMLAQVAQQLHVLETPPPGQVVDLSDPKLRHRRITNVGADFFEWADGGKTITWAVGSTFYRRSLASVQLNPPDQPSWSADTDKSTQAFDAIVEVPRDEPKGSLLLRGGRAITLRGDEVIDSAEILIQDGRIAGVGASGTLPIPQGTVVRDVTGKTIVPGFIDIHDHVADIRRDVLSLEPWGLAARLAYGITTSFDPSTLSIDMFAYQDLVDAGLVTGSRIPSTGTALFSFNRLASVDDAMALLTRYRDHYRTRNAKQYLIGNRRQREWLIQAAAKLGMMPTTEGSASLKLDLSQMMDGYSGNEHALPTALYGDVVQFVAKSRTSYDATLQIKNGGSPAQDDFVARDRPLEDPKFLHFRPYSIAVQSALTRTWTDPVTMLYPRIGGDVAKIQRAGGVVGMGSHGEIPGPGFHWEMEAHVQGGMTPLEALRAATIGSAEAIGRAGEFGSLEVGKFADLVILNSDPREDIRNSKDVREVMQGGRLYDAASLDEEWPRQKAHLPRWFDEDSPPQR